MKKSKHKKKHSKKKHYPHPSSPSHSQSSTKNEPNTVREGFEQDTFSYLPSCPDPIGKVPVHWSGAEYVASWEPFLYPTSYPGNLKLQIQKWTIYAKPTFPAQALVHIQNSFPGCDGWIFTRMMEKYRPYCSSPDACIKWKPTSLMTIDFEIRLRNETTKLYPINGISPLFTACTNGEYVLSVLSAHGHSLAFAFANLPLHLDLFSHIGEFTWNANTNAWKLIHLREDKDQPNSVETAVQTIRDLGTNISLSELANRLNKPYRVYS
jgi:hypothetical protein